MSCPVLRILSAEQAKLGAEVTISTHVAPTRRPHTNWIARSRGYIVVLNSRAPGAPAAPLVLAKGLLQQDLDKFDVIDAHSSWAGVVVRATAYDHTRWSRIWYSPHAYGFLRTDTHSVIRRSAVLAQRLLSRIGSVAAVSESEAELARDATGARRVTVLHNRVDIAALPRPSNAADTRTPLFVTAGRLVPQKDPERFACIAERLQRQAEFVWIGAGAEGERVFANSPVIALPWTSRDQTLRHLASASVYLSTSRWEGLPLALVEAQAIGLPAVGTDVPGNRDVIQHQRTGYLCEDDDDMEAACRTLLADSSRWNEMSDAARLSARERFDVGSLGAEALAMYSKAVRL